MKLLKVLLPLLLLGGCATTPVPERVTTGHEQLAAVKELPDDWQLQGRISLTQGDTGWHAGVDWSEHAGDFSLRVSGPLGQGGFLLTGNSGGVLLQDAGQQVYSAPNADILLYDVTGWKLPVTGMRYWVRGIPDPHARFYASLDARGRLTQLQQSGWTIRYSRYHPDEAARWPAKLSLLRDDVSVRMVIDRWAFGESGAGQP